MFRFWKWRKRRCPITRRHDRQFFISAYGDVFFFVMDSNFKILLSDREHGRQRGEISESLVRFLFCLHRHFAHFDRTDGLDRHWDLNNLLHYLLRLNDFFNRNLNDLLFLNYHHYLFNRCFCECVFQTERYRVSARKEERKRDNQWVREWEREREKSREKECARWR